VMTSFSQNQINETTFNLTLDGISSNDFLVTYNPQNKMDQRGPGVILVHFDKAVENIQFQCDGVIGGIGITDFYTEPTLGVGIYMIRVDYSMLEPGEVNIIANSFNDDLYLATKFNVLDTTAAFNNGVKSVDKIKYYNMGVASVNKDSIFNSGVKSVDTDYFYNLGVASVNKDSIFNSGVKSVDTDYFYNLGVESVIIPECLCDTTSSYYNGVSSVNTDSVQIFYSIGFEDGKTMASTDVTLKSAFDMNVNVYPNPVNKGEYINIDCFDYSHVDIYTIMGQTISKGISDSYISTDNMDSGIYFFNVWNRNNEYSIVKIIVK